MAYSTIRSDARVLRQIAALSRRFSVTALGNDELGTQHVPVPIVSGECLRRQLEKVYRFALLLVGKLFPGWAYERWYWSHRQYRIALEPLVKSRADVIHANDWHTLPVAVRAAKQMNAQVVLDLHEYAPGEWERWLWKLLSRPMIDYFLRRYRPDVAASITVNETIAARYRAEYGFEPVVIMNASGYRGDVNFRATNPQRIRLVHHGASIRDRKLELMVETIAMAGKRYSLDFVLMNNDPCYISQLKSLAHRIALGRVNFRDPVQPPEVVGMLSAYDVGIFVLPFTNFNYAAALPNKFFDFIAAGLAICIGPSLEMGRLVQQYGFGAVAASFAPSDVAALLNGLTASDIDSMKHKALDARPILSADVEMEKLLNLYINLPGTR